MGKKEVELCGACVITLSDLSREVITRILPGGDSGGGGGGCIVLYSCIAAKMIVA